MYRRPALAVVSAAALLLAAAPGAADIGPKPTTSGRAPGPSGTDVAGVEIEMVEEQVDLLLRPVAESRERLEVSAVFRMRNPGETATLETGFPIGAFRNFDAFSVEIDGRPVEFEVVDRAAARGPATGASAPRSERRSDYWYVWQATYPGHATSTHVVRYAVDLRRHHATGSAGYVLHTGAGWKGPIGRAVVTLRTAGALTLDHLVRIEPRAGGTRHEDRVEWHFTDLEPTEDHDIRVVYSDRRLPDEIAAAREAARTGWAGRTRLAGYLARMPDAWLREHREGPELDDYLDALGSLVAERRDEGDRVVLPPSTQGDRRAYASDPNALFRWMDEAARAVETHPQSPRAREVLSDYVSLCEAFLLGRLFAGEERVEYVWRGAVDTPEQRARRDASVAERRGHCEEWLARARRALTRD